MQISNRIFGIIVSCIVFIFKCISVIKYYNTTLISYDLSPLINLFFFNLNDVINMINLYLE